VTTSQVEQLTAALDEMTARLSGNVSSVSRVVNPLLDAWSLAHEIDPEVAQPLEGLLATLAYRTLVANSELAGAIDEVRLRLTRESAMAAEVAAG
jgi:hypothetical protein